MAKVIDGVKLGLKMWATVVLSAEEIQDLYPAFADMVEGDDTEELEQAIQEYMDMNYLDFILYADGGLGACKVRFIYEDDGSK
jgi:hypothetical protein